MSRPAKPALLPQHSAAQGWEQRSGGGGSTQTQPGTTSSTSICSLLCVSSPAEAVGARKRPRAACCHLPSWPTLVNGAGDSALSTHFLVCSTTAAIQAERSPCHLRQCQDSVRHTAHRTELCFLTSWCAPRPPRRRRPGSTRGPPPAACPRPTCWWGWRCRGATASDTVGRARWHQSACDGARHDGMRANALVAGMPRASMLVGQHRQGNGRA